MKGMKIASLIIAGLLACAASGPCEKKDKNVPLTDGPVQAPAFPGETKRVYAGSASLAVPENWEVVKRRGNPLLFSHPPGAGPAGPMANLLIENMTQRMEPFDYLQANIIGMSVSINDLEIARVGAGLTGGESYAWIQYRYTRREEPVEALAFCQTRDYQAYVVTAICPRSEFMEQEPLFRAIGLSLRIGRRPL